jgi:hypothetical protein
MHIGIALLIQVERFPWLMQDAPRLVADLTGVMIDDV